MKHTTYKIRETEEPALYRCNHAWGQDFEATVYRTYEAANLDRLSFPDWRSLEVITCERDHDTAYGGDYDDLLENSTTTCPRCRKPVESLIQPEGLCRACQDDWDAEYFDDPNPAPPSQGGFFHRLSEWITTCGVNFFSYVVGDSDWQQPQRPFNYDTL